MQQQFVMLSLCLIALLLVDLSAWQGTITAELAGELGEVLRAARWRLVTALPL